MEDPVASLFPKETEEGWMRGGNKRRAGMGNCGQNIKFMKNLINEKLYCTFITTNVCIYYNITGKYLSSSCLSCLQKTELWTTCKYLIFSHPC